MSVIEGAGMRLIMKVIYSTFAILVTLSRSKSPTPCNGFHQLDNLNIHLDLKKTG